METIKDIVKAIIFLFVVGTFVFGLKEMFKREKVYRENGTDIYHNTPYCDAIHDIESAREYMDETGEIVLSEEINETDAYNDTSLYMCRYCFSPLEIKYRAKHINELKERLKTKKK